MNWSSPTKRTESDAYELPVQIIQMGSKTSDILHFHLRPILGPWQPDCGQTIIICPIVSNNIYIAPINPENAYYRTRLMNLQSNSNTQTWR